MIKIEKTKVTADKINSLYQKNKVVFEHCILVSEDIEYSILYTPQHEIYDVVLYNFKNNYLINYEERKKLSGSTLEYYNLEKNQTKNDNFGNKFKCITHYIEYTDY